MELSHLISCYERGIQESITDDLLVEILVRLPLKSLCRFKCVSKSWNRLISENYLQQRPPSIVTGLFSQCESNEFKTARYAYASSNGKIQDCNLDFFPFDEKSTVVDGSNGLLLYYSSVLMTFYVVNTTMKSWVALPKPQKATQLSILAFDPYNSEDYRVVCFTAWRARGAELEVYNSDSGKWDQNEVQFGIKRDAISTRKHYSNGLLYILAYPNMIVVVDLMKLSCNLIQLPEPINSVSRVSHCQGWLHYAHINGNNLKIWIRNCLNRNKWGLKHEIDLREIIGRTELKPNQVTLLALHPEKDLIFVWIANWRIVCFDLKKRGLVGFWEFSEKWKKVHLSQIWLFPCSNSMAN